MNAHDDVDGIDGPFERAMEAAIREDARAAKDRQLRALFNDGRPAPIRFTGTMTKPGLAGYWPDLVNIHLELLRTAKRKWMTWDGADRVEFQLTNASAVYVRTEPAAEDQGAATLTFRLERGEVRR